MRTPFITSCTILFLLSVVSLSARPGNDPNAAVRYLLAIGQLPAVSETVIDDIGSIEKFEDLGKLSPEGRVCLDDEKFHTAVKLLKLGAACPECNFTPDDGQSFLDPVPPYKRMRQMVKLARAFSYDREKAGDLTGAVDLLTSSFMVGQHLEKDGTLISMMVGIACRKMAANALLEFTERHPETNWKERITGFFKRIPRPFAKIKPCVEYERGMVENTLKMAKKDPEMFRILELPVPGEKEAPKEPAQDSGLKICQSNQRVLTGAIEMMVMDHPFPLPATISADVPGALLSMKYILKPVVCPGEGEYKLTFDEKGLVKVECSKHGGPDTPSLAAKKEAAEQAEKCFQYYSKFSATPEYDRQVAECLEFYDELLSLDTNDPGIKATVEAIMKKVEASGNAFANQAIPNITKIAEQVRTLEELVDKLLGQPKK